MKKRNLCLLTGNVPFPKAVQVVGKGQGHPSFHKPQCTKWGQGLLIYTHPSNMHPDSSSCYSSRSSSRSLSRPPTPCWVHSMHPVLPFDIAPPFIVVLVYASQSVQVQMPVKVWLRPQWENGCVFWSICGVWTASLKLEVDALKGKWESDSWIAPHSTQLWSRSCLFAWFHWQVNSVKLAPMRYRRINNLFGCYALYMLRMCVYVHTN